MRKRKRVAVEKAEKIVPETEETEIPETWKFLPLEDMVTEGFKPYIKNVRGNGYIVMRKGHKDRSLGRFSDARWKLLHQMFPKLNSGNVSQESFPEQGESSEEIRHDMRPIQGKQPSSRYLTVPLRKPVIFPKQYQPSLKIVRFYEVYRVQGGGSEFSEFINDIVETHLSKCHGFLIDSLLLRA